MDTRLLGMARLSYVLVLFGSILSFQGVDGLPAPFQVFREPMQNVTLYEGQTATFTCYVLVSVGGTGWNHKSDMVYLEGKLMMGAGRKYYEDYRQHTGTHQLVISNVTADDDGPVACFTKWGSDDNDFDETQAYLNVLVPPSDISIVVRGSVSGGIAQYRMDEIVNLTCVAKGGRPHPKLIWYRGPRRIESDQENTLEEWYNATHNYNRLTFQATTRDDEASITCQAESPALAKPSAHSIQLIVEYPPKTPVITGTGIKKSVRVGADFSLTCVSESGNPKPQLTWFKNDVQEEASDNSPSRRDASSTLAFVPRMGDNGAVLKCEASNKLMPRAVSVQTTLDVQFGPSSVDLKGPTEIKPESAVELTCTSGPSNPASEITWTINGKPYREKSGRIEPAVYGAFVTTSIVKLVPQGDDSNDIQVKCEAINSATSEVSRSNTVVRVFPKLNPPQSASSATMPSKIDVYFDGKAAQPLNETMYLTGEPTEAGANNNMPMIIAVSASIGSIVFFALLACLVYVIIRGKSKKFEEMANSDSSGSSKGHTEVCSQNCMDIGTDATSSEVEKSHDIYSQITPKKVISPSAIRPNAASTYLLDDNYRSPYGTYRHWTAPEPVGHDLEQEVGVDYENENDYIEALRRSAMHSLMPYNHSPSPLRPVPNHITYEPIHKNALLSTFHGQQLYPNYRAETSVDELKGHLV